MRSSSSRRPGRHADVAPVGRARPPRRPRVLRGAVHGTLLLALVGATGAYASAVASSDRISVRPVSQAGAAEAPGLFAEAETAEQAALPRSVSRSQARESLPRAVTVAADGAERTVLTEAGTVAEVLDAVSVQVGQYDELSAALTAVPVDGSRIELARVAYVDGTERTEIPFRTRELADADLPRGEREVESAGVPGQEVVGYRARLVDGVEVAREELVRTVVEPEDRVVRVGTKAPVLQPVTRSTTSSSSSSSSASTPVAAGDARSIGRAMVLARGWGEDQWVCLDRLWTRESGWNPYARNASSGAYGIPQALPASKMATAGADYLTNPRTQITWGLGYIAGRYGTPCGAWSHAQSVGWY